MRGEAIVGLLAVAILAGAGVGFLVGVSGQRTTTEITTESTTVTLVSTTYVTESTTNATYVYLSDINSSNTCNYSNATVTSIVSNIESYPEFRMLEGNRTYTLGGYGCETAPAQYPIVTFGYYEVAHPISYQCGNHTLTTDPYYTIEVDLNVTTTGYDLTHSTYTPHNPSNFRGCPNFG
jgi:hypothetical protein